MVLLEAHRTTRSSSKKKANAKAPAIAKAKAKAPAKAKTKATIPAAKKGRAGKVPAGDGGKDSKDSGNSLITNLSLATYLLLFLIPDTNYHANYTDDLAGISSPKKKPSNKKD